MAKERSRSTPPPCSRALTPDLHAPFHCKVCALNHANYKVPTCHDAANQDMQRELHWSLHNKIMLLHEAHPTEPRGTYIERLCHPEQRELLSTARKRGPFLSWGEYLTWHLQRLCRSCHRMCLWGLGRAEGIGAAIKGMNSS